MLLTEQDSPSHQRPSINQLTTIIPPKILEQRAPPPPAVLNPMFGDGRGRLGGMIPQLSILLSMIARTVWPHGFGV